MIVLTGESAAGKSSIEKYLVNNCGYYKIVSYTTRQPRNGEINGIDYHFINDDKFETLRNKGFFVEHAQYNGWKYGIAKRDCTDNKIATLTPHGLRQVSKLKDINVTSFYIKVPRRDRLIKILQRGDNIEEAYRRNVSDIGQFDGIEDEVDFIIDNVGYNKTIMEVSEEIRSIAEQHNKQYYKR